MDKCVENLPNDNQWRFFQMLNLCNQESTRTSYNLPFPKIVKLVTMSLQLTIVGMNNGFCSSSTSKVFGKQFPSYLQNFLSFNIPFLLFKHWTYYGILRKIILTERVIIVHIEYSQLFQQNMCFVEIVSLFSLMISTKDLIVYGFNNYFYIFQN